MMIKINGPNLSENGGVLRRAVEKSKKGWHFVRGEKDIKNFLVSKVVDRKLKERSKFPFTV